MRKFTVVLPFVILATGCATGGNPAKPVIKDLESDKVIVQAVTDMFTTAPTIESLDAEAKYGCELHGKVAKSISYSCRPVDPTNSFAGSICEYLYACLAE